MLPFINIGRFAIPSKPFVIIIGIYICLWLVENTIEELGVEAEWIRGTAFNTLLIGLLGGRLVFAISHWQATLANPITLIWPITIGYSLWGAIIIGLLALLYAARKQQVNLFKLIDSIAPSLLILIGAWTIGDYLGGPGFGTAASLPGFTRHPVQVYELLVVLVSLLAWQQAKSQKRFDGWLFLVTAAVFCAGMSFTAAFRGGGITFLGGFKLNQIAICLMLIGALALLAFRTKSPPQESLTSKQ